MRRRGKSNPNGDGCEEEQYRLGYPMSANPWPMESTSDRDRQKHEHLQDDQNVERKRDERGVSKAAQTLGRGNHSSHGVG